MTASVKAILNEVEFCGSGAIDEKTRIELVKLLDTGAVITGRIGYVTDTFKINGWMINVQTNKDCFVTLLNVRSNGEIWELFPNSYNKNNFLMGNTRHTIPSSNDNFRLAIVAPSGQDYIKAIAASVPITREQISRYSLKRTLSW